VCVYYLDVCFGRKEKRKRTVDGEREKGKRPFSAVLSFLNNNVIIFVFNLWLVIFHGHPL